MDEDGEIKMASMGLRAGLVAMSPNASKMEGTGTVSMPSPAMFGTGPRVNTRRRRLRGDVALMHHPS